MKYERTTGEWMLHYQAQYGAPTIAQYSVKDPGFFDKPTRQAKAFPQNKIIRTGSKVVKTVTDPARQSSAA